MHTSTLQSTIYYFLEVQAPRCSALKIIKSSRFLISREVQAVIKGSSSINYGLFKPQLRAAQAVIRPLPTLIDMRYTRQRLQSTIDYFLEVQAPPCSASKIIKIMSFSYLT